MNKNEKIVEGLLHGGLKVLQKKEGYRFSMDAVLLANFVTVKQNERIADLGTGCGVIPLIVAFRNPTSSITAVEIDETVALMARESVAMNNLSDRISVLAKDIKDLAGFCTAGSFDVVITNPPYGKVHAGRISPDSKRALARHEITGNLADFLKSAAFLLKFRGRLAIIYPAGMLTELIIRLRERDLEPKRLRMIYTGKDRGAKLVLLEAVRGGGREVEVLQPLFIYDDEGNYTEEFKQMYRQ